MLAALAALQHRLLQAHNPLSARLQQHGRHKPVLAGTRPDQLQQADSWLSVGKTAVQAQRSCELGCSKSIRNRQQASQQHRGYGPSSLHQAVQHKQKRKKKQIMQQAQLRVEQGEASAGAGAST